MARLGGWCWAPARLPRAARVDAEVSVNWPDEQETGREEGRLSGRSFLHGACVGHSVRQRWAEGEVDRQ